MDSLGVSPSTTSAELNGPGYQRDTAISTYNDATVPLVTARGCPFTCSFCDIITMWGRTVGFRSIDDVVREVGAIASAGTRKIMILDDLFTVNRKRVIAFCRALRSAGLDVKWSCTSRIDLLDDELLDEMADAGCTCIYFGVDASTEDGWKKINKKLTRDQVLNAIKMTLKRCRAYASFILGYPFETFADFTATICQATSGTDPLATSGTDPRVDQPARSGSWTRTTRSD